MNGNMPINLVLSLDTVNMVLGALSQMPYQQVVGVIASITHQTQAEVNRQQPSVTPPETPNA